MNPERRLLLSSLLLSAPILALAHPASKDPSSLVTRTLTVGGRVQNRLALSPEALQDFPVQLLPEIPIVGRSGETRRILKDYAGVKLTDVLDKSVLVSADHDDLKRTVIVATASDDYKAVFSWNELYNTVVGQGVLVLISREGKPLGDEEGKLALISTRDLHTGPRHVRWLRDVEARKIA